MTTPAVDDRYLVDPGPPLARVGIRRLAVAVMLITIAYAIYDAFGGRPGMALPELAVFITIGMWVELARAAQKDRVRILTRHSEVLALLMSELQGHGEILAHLDRDAVFLVAGILSVTGQVTIPDRVLVDLPLDAEVIRSHQYNPVAGTVLSLCLPNAEGTPTS